MFLTYIFYITLSFIKTQAAESLANDIIWTGESPPPHPHHEYVYPTYYYSEKKKPPLWRNLENTQLIDPEDPNLNTIASRSAEDSLSADPKKDPNIFDPINENPLYINANIFKKNDVNPEYVNSNKLRLSNLNPNNLNINNLNLKKFKLDKINPQYINSNKLSKIYVKSNNPNHKLVKPKQLKFKNFNLNNFVQDNVETYDNPSLINQNYFNTDDVELQYFDPKTYNLNNFNSDYFKKQYVDSDYFNSKNVNPISIDPTSLNHEYLNPNMVDLSFLDKNNVNLNKVYSLKRNPKIKLKYVKPKSTNQESVNTNTLISQNVNVNLNNTKQEYGDPNNIDTADVSANKVATYLNTLNSKNSKQKPIKLVEEKLDPNPFTTVNPKYIQNNFSVNSNNDNSEYADPNNIYTEYVAPDNVNGNYFNPYTFNLKNNELISANAIEEKQYSNKIGFNPYNFDTKTSDQKSVNPIREPPYPNPFTTANPKYINTNNQVFRPDFGKPSEDNFPKQYDSKKLTNANMEGYEYTPKNNQLGASFLQTVQEDFQPSTSTLVKNKLISLAKDTVQELQSKLEVIRKVHEYYKNNQYYKLGYVISYLNKTSEAVGDFMNAMEKNKDIWNVMRILNAYEQINKTKKFLSQFLHVLKRLKAAPAQSPSTSDKEREGALHGIAWSYYDDSIN